MWWFQKIVVLEWSSLIEILHSGIQAEVLQVFGGGGKGS